MSNGLDIVILIMAVVAGYMGWRIGLVRAGRGLVGTGGGIFLAQQYTYKVTPYVAEFITNPELAYLVGYGAMVLGAFVASMFIGTIARRFLQLIFLGWADRAAGAAAGLALMLGVLAVGLSLAGPLVEVGFPGIVENSRLGQTLVEDAPQLLGMALAPVKEYVEIPQFTLDIQ